MSTSSGEGPRFGAGPRLCRDLAVVASAAGLVVEGGSRQHVFRGRAATEVLPRLLPLLDGSRDAAGLAERLGITAVQVNQVLELLTASGLLEAPASADLLTADFPTGADPAVLSWFSRNLPDSGGRACAEEVLAALAETTVVVVAVPDLADRLVVDLTGAGIGRVVAIDDAGAFFPEPVRGRSRVLGVTVACDAGPDADFGGLERSRSRMAEWAAGANVPVLNVAWTEGFVDIGPVSLAGFTACPDCSRRSRGEAAASGAGEADAMTLAMALALGSASASKSVSGIADLAAGLATAQLVALAARLPSAADPRTMTRVSTADFGSESFWVVPYEDCDSCCGLVRGHTDPAHDRFIDVFEWSVQELPSVVSPGRAIPPWEMERILALKWRRPTLPTLPRRPLPPAVLRAPGRFASPAEPSIPRGASPDVDLWATLLRQTAGFHAAPTADSTHRWAPSGGGLASVELFVIDEAGVDGLPGTVFRYDDLTHSLLAVRDDHIKLAEVLECTDLDAAEVTAVAVFVAAHSRLATKYREYAYRVDHLDAGVASTQFTAVARAHGLLPRFATCWDGRVAEALGLARDDEFVTAVAGLYAPTPIRRPDSHSHSHQYPHTEGTSCR